MSRIRRPVLLTALFTAALGVLMPVSASFAAQQVTQSLTPPPPSRRGERVRRFVVAVAIKCLLGSLTPIDPVAG